MSNTQKEKFHKLCIIGDGGCGKTSLLSSYFFKTFSEEYDPTIFDNFDHSYRINDQEKLLRFVWYIEITISILKNKSIIRVTDTAGQEFYDYLRSKSIT